jgi:hypothetical protein
VAISLQKILTRIGKRLAILAAIVLIASIYAKVRYPSEAKDLATQRAILAGLQRGPQPQRLDHAAIIETNRKLSAAEFEGRAVGTEGGRKAQEYIASRFRAMKLHCFTTDCRMPFTRWQRSRLHQLIFGKDEIKPNDAANVMGYVRGTAAPGEYLVVSAHFDHMGKKGGTIYYGADDNASGVAALLAIAQYFAAHPPQHSIIFVAFDAEEKGLQGAKTFVRNPPVKKDAILLNVNMDMIGRNTGNEIFISGTFSFLNFVRWWNRCVRRLRWFCFLGTTIRARGGTLTTIGQTLLIKVLLWLRESRRCMWEWSQRRTTTSLRIRLTRSIRRS